MAERQLEPGFMFVTEAGVPGKGDAIVDGHQELVKRADGGMGALEICHVMFAQHHQIYMTLCPK